jgi:ribosomal peptide maturation radical SAM protein 1
MPDPGHLENRQIENESDALREDLLLFNFSFLQEGDALLIVPPFASLERPSLAVHLLQACARKAGFRVSVLYANMILAASIGRENYNALCFNLPHSWLIGERFFARTAYDVPPFGRDVSQLEADCATRDWGIGFPELQRLETKAAPVTEGIASAMVPYNFNVVGCTTSFHQTASSVALLNRIKRKQKEIVTIIGGPNCEGEMAEGIASLSVGIDYIFDGECEFAFPEFLISVADGNSPLSRIIRGQPCANMDAIPTPNFTEYYEQHERLFPEIPLETTSLSYETSRGCWWGQKHHCTFCGLNGLGLAFREKSPERVISELRELVDKYPSQLVNMTDNIMPHTYFQTLLPHLATEGPKTNIFYEQKANLSLEKVITLKKAGVNYFQPGIEALSTSLLRRMDKGVSGPQNVEMMRYARSVGVRLVWNLLYAFPGDESQEYEETRALLPLLRHLTPPTGVWPVLIERFSPYFDRPEDYRVSNIKPVKAYAALLPSHANLEKIAYDFTADYQSASRECSDIISEIKSEVDAWREAWFCGKGAQPDLSVTKLSNKAFLLRDTRGLPGIQEVQFLNRHEASRALVCGRRITDLDLEWALERKLGVEMDGRYVPLAIAVPELIQEFREEQSAKQTPETAFKSIRVLKSFGREANVVPDAVPIP